MVDANLRRRLCWMGGGLVLGLVFGGFWPDSPAHAVATSQIDNFSACTAPLDSEIEGIFLLDSITGELKGAALNQKGAFTTLFSANVAAGLQLDATAKPRYLLVSGNANFRGGASGNARPASSVLYVAEMTSGKVVAYGIPWSNQRLAGNFPLQLIGGFSFRGDVVRNAQ